MTEVIGNGKGRRGVLLYDANGNPLVLTDDGNVPTETKKTFFTQNPDGTERQVTTQNPFPVSDGLACANDIWVSQSQLNDFTGGVVTDLFDNLHTVITDNTANDPKEIIIHFGTTVLSNLIGIGAFNGNGGQFSNVEIQAATSDGIFNTVVDESGDPTIKQTDFYQLPINAGFNAIKLLFHTTNSIVISNLIIPKLKGTVSRLQGVTAAGVVVDIAAVTGENGQYLGVSLDQIDPTTNSLKVMQYSHAELHSGDRFVTRRFENLDKNGVKQFLVITPNTTRWPHMQAGFDTSASPVVVDMYRAPTYSSAGSLMDTLNRNGNSLKVNTTLVYEDPVIVTKGDLVPNSFYLGSGRGNSGSARDGEELMLRQNTAYLLEATEQNVTATVLSWFYDWYEHTNAA